MAEEGGTFRRVSGGGIAASHPELNPLPILVGASAGEEFNAIRSFLVPRACFRREDNSFDFDSSFIFDFDAGPLKELFDKHPGSVISIFGHTDPVGRDDYNKVLSGRRAQAVFGLLLRDVKIWEDLYRHHDSQGKDKWGVKSVQIMLNRVGFLTGRSDGVLDEPTKEQLKKYETARQLSAGGFDAKQEISRPTFQKLSAEYMGLICTDDDSKDFRLTRDDFLARGEGKDGKGDVQGCGEFNPILLFSKADKAELDKPERHQERNGRNRPNRRVMILLFRPGSEIDPKKWPCPTFKEGVSGCKARFFSDGEKRRSHQEKERKFQETKDTFACRFYHRLLVASPCERVLASFAIRLFDPSGKPLPGAPFLIVTGSRRLLANADSNADAVVQDLHVPTTCKVFWSRPSQGRPPAEKPEEFDFRLDVHVDIDDGADGAELSDDAALMRLSNLGYSRNALLEENVKDFQIDIGKPEDEITGRLADIKEELKKRHDTLSPPDRKRRLGTV
jgi:Putative peptidoglycan binding domain